MIQIKAVERKLTVGENAGEYRYMMQPVLYSQLNQKKVISEASVRSGITKASLNASWQAIAEVIEAWATEGHSVAIPGLGSVRFSLTAKSVADVNKVSTDLIESRKVVFRPSTEIRQELAKTSVSITCYDRHGNVVKRVTDDTTDETIDDGSENTNPGGGTGNGSGSGSGNDAGGSGEGTGTGLDE